MPASSSRARSGSNLAESLAAKLAVPTTASRHATSTPTHPTPTLTKRQQEVLDRLGQGMGAKQIANDIGVSRNAVYQHIERLRRQGALAESYTPSGQPPRRLDVGSAPRSRRRLAPRESALARLRELARGGRRPRRRRVRRARSRRRSPPATPSALAYELGRLDASGEARAARRPGRVGAAAASVPAGRSSAGTSRT